MVGETINTFNLRQTDQDKASLGGLVQSNSSVSSN